MKSLDINSNGTLEFNEFYQFFGEDIDAKNYIDWGIDFIKVDNCYYLDPGIGSRYWTYGGGYTGFWPTNFDYTLIRSSADGKFGPDGKWNNKFESIPRYAAQSYGRPYKCLAPVHGVFEHTFADKDFDSRYDGTFTTVYRATWHRNLSKPAVAATEFVYNANNMKVYQGGVIFVGNRE